MNRLSLCGVALLASGIVWGCADDPVVVDPGLSCAGDGAYVEVPETVACVYQAPIIETGFRCQKEVPWDYLALDALVCAGKEALPQHTLEKIVRKAFGATGEGGAGGSEGEGGSPGAGGELGAGGDPGTGGSVGAGGEIGAGGSGGAECLTQPLTPIGQDVEVLFVVDDSGSMMGYQLLAQSDVGDLFASLSTSDWQAGVTTTDTMPTGPRGRLVPIDGSRPRIVDGTLPDPIAAIGENILVGSSGAATERGIEAAVLALTPPLIDSADDPSTAEPQDGNLGFLRPSSHLAIVFISDEEDFSPQSVADAHQALEGAVGGNSARLSIHAILLEASLCGGNSRYAQLAQLTSGRVEELCNLHPTASDMAAALTNIGADIGSGLAQIRWEGGTPVDVDGDGVVTEADLVLIVDGVPLAPDSNGTQIWTWDDAAQEIVFADHTWPPAGSVVELANGCTP